MVLKAIASGLRGTHAFFRGTGTAFLGLVLHFFIACDWAAIFVATAGNWSYLTHRGCVVRGMLYDFAIYIVMNEVVPPLSGFPKSLWRNSMWFEHIGLGIAGYALFIGLHIASRMRYSVARLATR